ncbi:MAG: hypothetical protein ACKVLE_02275 [Fidelibacterota bacterium]|tara:strand:+ start:7702 stop:8184 length:483 start_codon:yes stop_codon:yes gene_type:complete
MNMKFTYLISWVDKNNLTAMQKVFLVLFGLLFSISLLQAQSVDDLESFGFIEIKTDSMNVSFFIDGYYVGNHPLGGPVPVLPGFHEVSYIPPNIQNEKIRNNLSDGIKRVYVAENDTLEVFLFYDHYLTQIETMENELKIQNYVGFSLIGVLIFVILSIF